MFVNIDAPDIAALSQQFGTLVGELLEVVNMPGQLHDIEITPAGNFRGFDDRQFYLILGGSVSARYHGKSIYTSGDRRCAVTRCDRWPGHRYCSGVRQ